MFPYQQWWPSLYHWHQSQMWPQSENTARSRRNARKLELTQPVVILCQCTLTLKELDEDSRLIISWHGEECSTLVHSRDGSISGNKFSEDITSSGLNTKCKQADINLRTTSNSVPCSCHNHPWHLINPKLPFCLIMSMHLLPVPLYVPMFPDWLYSPCIVTDQWVLCPFCLSIQLSNMFPFTIPVTYCSHPNILINMICLGDSVTYITELTHHAVQTVLIIAHQHPWPPEHHPVHSTLVYKPMYSICCCFSLNIK